MTPSLSVALPPTTETPDLAVYAEELGYGRVWVYDTPALQLDVWMTLALCASRTERVGLGPAVLIPSLRHPLATASAILHLESLAAGRTAYAVGSGFTGRRALGLRPMKWSDVVAYVKDVQALLRGETVTIDDAAVAMLHGDGQAPARPIEVPWLVGASGPKGLAAATELGAGVFSNSPVAGFEWSALLAFGTVLDDGEAPSSERVREAAGPAAAVAYHALYEQRRDVLARLPGAGEWTEAIERVPGEVRHLAIHRGHLTELNDIDRLIITGEIAVGLTTLSGTASAVRERVEQLGEAGVTEIAYQPSGPDLRREMRAFINAAHR
ncbi:MAG: LLM class flavin-dependent oxidoreductase [Acidimicrobiia bacterium]